MKFSEKWLREWVNPAVDTETLCAQLTMSGLEVDAITPVGGEFSGVVVGRVTTISPHPEADRLQICEVDVAEDAPLVIVCGAKNVHLDMRVATAKIGSVLPGFKIKKSKLRGVHSFGMLCSEKELGLAESADGLMSLPLDAEIGADVFDYLQLDDVSIELGLTPNRSDCLSIAGVAREVGVLNRCAVKTPFDVVPVASTISDTFSVKVADDEACPRYVGRVIKGVDTKAATPLWMVERLRRSDVRSISVVVDVTNYAMLELGQPMHAFDLAKLNGGIEVRHAAADEKLTLLDGQEISLTTETLVIADADKPLALAGIMGGLDSSVTDDTQDLFLESAFFSADTIAGKARHYGLHTDSSHRFERGVDYDLAVRAMERATELLIAMAGGEVGPLTICENVDKLPEHQPVNLRASRIERLLGISFETSEVTDILTRLGLFVTSHDGHWSVVSPSFRSDIAIEADLIEEVARIHGYDNFPDARPQATLGIEPGRDKRSQFKQLRQLLVCRGYQEVISYSFVSAKMNQVLAPQETAIALANPISADLAVMRTSLWPGLVEVLNYNLNRQIKRIKLFECGNKYIKQGDDIIEEKMVSGVICGDLVSPQWGEAGRSVDFFDIKADVESLLTGCGCEVVFEARSHPVLHPGQSAAITATTDGRHIGWVGALHPLVAKQLDVELDTFVFEVSADVLEQRSLATYEALSRFPSVKRDLAFIVEEAITSQNVRDSVQAFLGDKLKRLDIFDVYRGKGIEKGRKSIAMGLTLQDFSRTLADDDINGLIEGVLTQLSQDFGATLRE